MKRHWTGLLVALGIVLWIAPITAQKTAPAEAMLAAAQQKANIEGDLDGAIKQYKDIVTRYGKSDHGAAATALLRMADLYRRKGADESRAVYQQILRDYSDQKEAVTIAKSMLAGEASAGTVTQTVWTKEGCCGRLSHDGRFFTYRDRDKGDIFIHDIATGLDRNLTSRSKDSTDTVYESVISPDGRKVAYTWRTQANGRYTLRLADLAGDPNPRTLYDDPELSDLWLHDWSPDNRFLAVSVLKVDNSAQIGLISVSDGTFRQLESTDWRGIGTMRFSPDGKYVGYDRPQSDTAKEKDVFVLALDGSRKIRAVSNESDESIVGWSPDGNWLLFVSDRSGTKDLWMVAFVNGESMGSPQLVRPKVGEGFRPMGWTPSGGLYYQTSLGGGSTSQSYVGTIDWSVGKISSAPLGTRGYLENTNGATWSPDGKNLAYLSSLRPSTGNDGRVLEIRSIDTGTTRVLPTKQLSSIGIMEAWSPDGHYLWIVGNAAGGDQQQIGNGLYRVDANTGEATAIIRYDQYDPEKLSLTIGVRWLPDGVSFTTGAFKPKASAPERIRVDAQTGNITKLGPDEDIAGDLVWSSDRSTVYSRRLIPATENEGSSVAFIEQDLSTGKKREVIRRSSLGNINMSPDDRYIVTGSTDRTSNSRLLLLIPVQGGEVRELMRVPSEVKAEDLGKPREGQVVFPIRWAADSRSILVRKTPADRKKDSEFLMIPVSGGDPRRVDGTIPGSVEQSSVSSSSDGIHFVYTITESAPPAKAEIAVMENFLPKAVKK